MVEIESITVKLGDKNFEIRTAGFMRSKPWKKQLIAEIQPLFEQIGGIQNLTFDSPADLLKLIPVMENILLDTIDKVFELLIAYDPNLQIEHEYIEAHATDKQILAAFQGVVKLADPFGVVQMMGLKFGLQETGISLNLQSANGVLA